jgi:hypothetical protein
VVSELVRACELRRKCKERRLLLRQLEQCPLARGLAPAEPVQRLRSLCRRTQGGSAGALALCAGALKLAHLAFGSHASLPIVGYAGRHNGCA